MATEKIKLLLSAVDEIRSNMVTKDDLRSLIDMITTQQKKNLKVWRAMSASSKIQSSS